jgi:hypothetical protein
MYIPFNFKRFLQEVLIAMLVLAAFNFALTQTLHAISWATGFAQITVDRTFACFAPLIAIVGFAIHVDIFHRIALLVPGFTIAALIPILDELAGRRHPFLWKLLSLGTVHGGGN